MRAITRGEGPKLLSLAPMRARKGRPRSRSCASGPTNGTVEGSAATSEVRGGRWRMARGSVESGLLLAWTGRSCKFVAGLEGQSERGISEGQIEQSHSTRAFLWGDRPHGRAGACTAGLGTFPGGFDPFKGWILPAHFASEIG